MTRIDWARIQKLGMPRVSQLGFVVADMEASLPVYASLFNIQTWYRTHFVDRVVTYKGQNYDVAWDLVFGFSGKLQLELIDFKGNENNIYFDFLSQNEAGLHHLGFFTSDIGEKVALAQALGIEVLQTVSLRTKGGFSANSVYLNTVEYCGILLELFQVKSGKITVPNSKWLMELGTLIGDGTKLKV